MRTACILAFPIVQDPGYKLVAGNSLGEVMTSRGPSSEVLLGVLPSSISSRRETMKSRIPIWVARRLALYISNSAGLTQCAGIIEKTELYLGRVQMVA